MGKLDKYLHLNRMPHFACPGCAHGIAWASMIRAIDQLGLDQSETVMVCAIGCAGRLPVYLNFPTIRTAHGRALPVATGIKLANPKNKVIAFMGDGDAAAIGGNHLIHAARRNIDITAIVAMNEIYGMTGGQYAPTTGVGKFASTAPFGMIEPQMDICKLVIGAGATFVARGDAYHVSELQKLISLAIQHKGFSVVEALTTCPTHFGRRNKITSPSKLLERLKDLTITKSQAEKMSPEEKKNKLVRGVLLEEDRPEYIEEYDRITGFKEIEV
jgi:2-oxoglutarate/2-oxoacid ferredoxin oxidoreductase subunit beta